MREVVRIVLTIHQVQYQSSSVGVLLGMPSSASGHAISGANPVVVYGLTVEASPASPENIVSHNGPCRRMDTKTTGTLTESLYMRLEYINQPICCSVRCDTHVTTK